MEALKSGLSVLPLFIFDSNILKALPKRDARVEFLHDTLSGLKARLKKQGSDLLVKAGDPIEVWHELVETYDVKAVYTNHDFEPYALRRDTQVQHLLESKDIPFHTFKDHVIFEKDEVLKDDGKPYTVFTPYSKKWRVKLTAQPVEVIDTVPFLDEFASFDGGAMPRLRDDLGFETTGINIPPIEVDKEKIGKYDEQRDFPGIKGTSRLGVHLRFGTIGVRTLWKMTEGVNHVFHNQLIWRDFYFMILHHFPHVVNGAFRPEYDRIAWENNETYFEAWREGNTGYPLVDAGMRELNTTGYMHNRVRMVTASFLTKHLLIDWRWGEAYFAEKLLDFDLSANNGSWQWAAGCGCDAAPYFRVFNPELQAKRFDPKLEYIRKWVPELQSFDYPDPIVDHKIARKKVVEVYKAALNG